MKASHFQRIYYIYNIDYKCSALYVIAIRSKPYDNFDCSPVKVNQFLLKSAMNLADEFPWKHLIGLFILNGLQFKKLIEIVAV